MLISLIAAVDQQFGLGKDNALLCHLPADLNYFKSKTKHKPIIMGYNTFCSIGKALPFRKNIVLTSKCLERVEDVSFVNTLEDALGLCGADEEIMIIGGAKVYQQTLPLAKKIYLTFIEHIFEADAHFPQFDISQWDKLSEERYDQDDKNPYSMRFTEWQRKAV